MNEPVPNAACWGCGRALSQPQIVMRGADGELGYAVPMYHAECVPAEERAGSRWIRRNQK